MASLWQNRNFRENAVVLAVFLTGVHLLYGKTVGAGFVTDFTGLLERLDGAPFSDFLHCFGFPAMHQVTNFFLYFFVKWFGLGGLPWYLVFTTLHVVNGLLGFRLAKKILAKAGIESPAVPAFMAATLFIFSPYQADAVVWKVCFNFLFCSQMMLGSLLLLVKYFEQKKRKDLLLSHALFLVALFTFELSLSLPVLALALAFWWASTPATSVASGGSPRAGSMQAILSFLKKIGLPHALFVAGYFFLNKFLLGGWVGHYGESVHLNFDLRAIASNLLKYFSKYLAFWREMPHSYREQLLAFFEKPAVAFTGMALGMLLLFLGVLFFKKMKLELRAAGLGWLLFFIALLPVSNLYVAWVLQGENDRYGYLASLFFFIGLVSLLQLLHRYIRYGVFAVWLMLSIFYLNKMTVAWENGTRIVSSLLDGFRWMDAPEVYVLAFPENFNGVPMFKDFSRQDKGLKDALKYLAGKEVGGRFYQVAQFNMASMADGLSARADSAGVFHVEFGQWGNWWWRHGIGTGGYETEQYRFSPEGNGCRVELKKPPIAGAVFIFADGAHWKEVPRPTQAGE